MSNIKNPKSDNSLQPAGDYLLEEGISHFPHGSKKPSGMGHVFVIFLLNVSLQGHKG